MSDLAQLIIAAVRWDAERGFAAATPEVERALALGVGGFLLLGGERDAVAAFTAQLRAATHHPLLVAADLERGAGQVIAGCTRHPPAATLASLGDPLAIGAVARQAAREALALGVNWALAPVADLDLHPANPVTGARSLGSDPEEVAAGVTEWIDAIQGEGMLACAKHFPGHGRTTEDSHTALPVVTATRQQMQVDLAPFIAAIDTGVATIMTAHVAYPALDPSGAPATVSRAIVHTILREELGYEGLIVTDALVMFGAKDPRGEGNFSGRAVAAGCDLLLHPSDPAAALHGLEVVAGRTVSRAQLDASLARRGHSARWGSR